MDDKALFRISLAFAVLGMSFLFFISENIEIRQPDIAKINDLEKYVKLEGTVTRATKINGNLFLRVAQEEQMSVVLFDEDSEIRPGDKVEIVGRLEEYKGEYEVIGEELYVR